MEEKSFEDVVNDSLGSLDINYESSYTHEINFEEVKTVEDVVAILKSLQVSVDPEQWEQDKKYIKPIED